MLNGLFIPHLLKQEDPVIINVTSVLGFTPIKTIPIYCSLKAGFHLYSVLLRYQLSNTPIQVVEVVPPKVATELNMEGRKKLGNQDPNPVYLLSNTSKVL
jgi:uncharacterized oxidoreductase